jgi:serine/threonine protein kinase
MFEAQKQAAESSDKVIKIYHAGILSRHFYTTMEFYESIDLRSALKEISQQGAWLARWHLGLAYIFLIEETTKPRLLHGDPHAGNVLVGDKPPSQTAWERVSLKLCDYGTSRFNGKAVSEKRHWAVVAQTLEEIFGPFEMWQAQRDIFLKSWSLGEESKYNLMMLKHGLGALWGDVLKRDRVARRYK